MGVPGIFTFVLPRLRPPSRQAGEGCGPFAGSAADRPLRMLIDLPASAKRLDASTQTWDELGVPDTGQFLWSLCMRDEIEMYWMGEQGDPAPGRVRLGEQRADHDQLLFSTDGEHGATLRGLWPYHQYEAAARDLAVRAGTDNESALNDVLVGAVGHELRVDVLATDRLCLLEGRVPSVATVNAMTVEQALSVVGLYLRRQGIFTMWAPDMLSFGEHLMRWVAVRAKLPQGWRWGGALVAYSRHTGLEGPTQLFGSTLERLVRVLRYRDQLHSSMLVPQDNATADAVTEALDNFLVNLVGSFDAAARVAHLAAGLGSSKRYEAAWQNDVWRKKLRQPALYALFAKGSAGSDLFKVCRILRNTVHGEGLQGRGISSAGRPASTFVALPEDDGAECAEVLDRLGGRAAWGLTSLGRSQRLDAATFIERLLPDVLDLLDTVLRLTPVEDLDGVAPDLLPQRPPDSPDFTLGARVRSCLLHGLPPPAA